MMIIHFTNQIGLGCSSSSYNPRSNPPPHEMMEPDDYEQGQRNGHPQQTLRGRLHYRRTWPQTPRILIGFMAKIFASNMNVYRHQVSSIAGANAIPIYNQ